MRNLYIHFAAHFGFPEAAAADFMNIIHALKHRNRDALPQWFIEQHQIRHDDFDLTTFMYDENLFDIGCCLAFPEYAYKDGILSIWASERADIDSTATILSEVMKQHDVDSVIPMEGVEEAQNEDDPGRSDYSGFAFAIGPGIVRNMDTGALMESLIQDVRAELYEESMKPGY